MFQQLGYIKPQLNVVDMWGTSITKKNIIAPKIKDQEATFFNHIYTIQYNTIVYSHFHSNITLQCFLCVDRKKGN